MSSSRNVFAFLVSGIIAASCSSEPEPQSAANQGYGAGYSQQTGYPQQSGYPQQGTYGQLGYPTATTTATAPATATAPSPSLVNIPCQADSGCGTHKCNLTTQTCILPCAGNQDCAAGTACTMGVCIPGMGQ